MNKSILISCSVIAFISFSAFGYMNWNNSNDSIVDEKVEDADFYYAVGPRFDGVTKTALNKATSILDFLNEYQAPPSDSYKEVTIIIVENEQPTDTRESGTTDILTDGQRNLLLSAEYSTHFSVQGQYHGYNLETDKIDHSRMNPYLTIVPEKQAAYVDGSDTLLEYFRVNNKKNLKDLDSKKVRPAKLYFTVTRDGSIANIKIRNPSGYQHMDDTMIHLLKNLPGSWTPAEDINGEKVDQELVVSYSMKGC